MLDAVSLTEGIANLSKWYRPAPVVRGYARIDRLDCTGSHYGAVGIALEVGLAFAARCFWMGLGDLDRESRGRIVVEQLNYEEGSSWSS